MTSKCDMGLTVGETVDLTGTIKKFDEYMNIRQTHLTRCNVKKVEE
jgi:small nuclear ribonucleoprotein (snRNP)-like protein